MSTPQKQNTQIGSTNTEASTTSPVIPQAVFKELHPDAAKLARSYSRSFAESLILHAKSLAEENNDEIVLTNHIKSALEIIRREPRRKRWKDLTIFVSSTILGVSAQSFVAEILKFGAVPSTGNIIAALIYAAATLIAVVVAVIAIVK